MAQFNQSLISRFIAQYYPAQAVPPGTLPTASPDELEQIYGRLRQANAPLRVARLSPHDRAALRGKAGPSASPWPPARGCPARSRASAPSRTA